MKKICRMRYAAITILLVQLIGFSSCDLFGGGNRHGAKAGEVVWKVTNQTERLVATQPLVSNGRVYFLQDGYLKAYTLTEGNALWSKQIATQSSGDYSRQMVEAGNRLFVDQGYNMKAFDKSDGTLIWNTRITDNAQEVSGIGSPIMSQDADYLYAGRKGYVLKVRKSDGQIVQRYPLDRLVPDGVKQGSTEPTISPFGDDHLYIPTNYINREAENPLKKGNIFSYSASTGQYQWGYEIPNHYHYFKLQDGRTDSSLIQSSVFDAQITKEYVVVLAGSSVLALDRLTGEKVWETFFSGDIIDGFDVGLAIQGDGIYITSAGYHATKLDLKTGNIVWRRDITFSNTSIPTVQDGRLYFNNSGGGGIWVLDTADGAVIFHKNTPNYKNDDFDVYISSLGVGEGYMVDVGSKAVYCLRVP